MIYSIEELENWQLAYIAGIVDGEGCFNLTGGVGKRGYARISIGMGDIHCITLLYTKTGMGNVNTQKYLTKQIKTVYLWVLSNRLEIYTFIKAIYPYLITKRKQADVMLNYIERRIQNKPFTLQDAELIERLHELNKQGVVYERTNNN